MGGMDHKKYNINSNSFALDKELLLWSSIHYNQLYIRLVHNYYVLLDMWSYLLAIYVRILQLNVNC